MSKLQIVVGGQFGSEGKGACAAALIAGEETPLAIRTGGPNAGHTVYAELPEGGKVRYALRQLPVAAVANPSAEIALAAGSLVNLEVLEAELEQTGRAHVWIDRAATVLEPRHIEAEGADPAMQWGSTKKGIGAARMDRLHRTAMTWGAYYTENRSMVGMNVADLARASLHAGRTVQIEAAQGYGLGLHTRFYPKTTSANCRAIDALADVGLSPWEFQFVQLEIWVVFRPFPIRVAGDSGPLKDETTWAELGLPEERTTVTNKVRRVGLWDRDLAIEAVGANGGKRFCKVWLSMADHIAPALAGATTVEQMRSIPPDQREALTRFTYNIQRATGATVRALGTGPDTAIFLGYTR